MDEKKSDFVVERPLQRLGGALEFGGNAPAVLSGVDQPLSAFNADGNIAQMAGGVGQGVGPMGRKRQNIGGLVALSPPPVEFLDLVVVRQKQ